MQKLHRQSDILSGREGKLAPVLKQVCFAVLTLIRQNIPQAYWAMHSLDSCIKGAWCQHENEGHCCCMLCMRPSWIRCAVFPSLAALTPSSKADRGRLLTSDILLGFRHGMAATWLPLTQRRLFLTEQKSNFGCSGGKRLGCQHILSTSSIRLQLREGLGIAVSEVSTYISPKSCFRCLLPWINFLVYFVPSQSITWNCHWNLEYFSLRSAVGRLE